MESREHCSCCRGRKSIVRRSDDDLRKTCRVESISGKSLSSPKKHVPGCPRRIFEEEKQYEIASCADKFALAKRLHAENLQHQPLPDRVDDSVFRKEYRSCSAGCERDAECQARDDTNVATLEAKDHPFGPALGCKKPKTRMDLAICWETPMDPVYEPRRPTHIDGSEGGLAPAIFALIQHTPVPKNRELLVRGEGRKSEHGNCGTCARQHQKAQLKNPRQNRCCCDCTCNEARDKLPRGGKSVRSSSVPRITERKCAACRGEPEAEAERRRRSQQDPRLIRSAVGVALGLEQRCRATDDDGARQNGLPPARAMVPRPRTPFARRAFCIDTLAPPFSVMSGCRDADYPEHWRLMSVYQQSYRNPQKRRIRRF